MARKHPRQIARIYIRNVTGASRNDERFKALFAGIEPHRWQLFTDPAALELPE
jgi:phosphatidate phosphatase APP1